MHFPETDLNQLTVLHGILYDLVYVLVFLGDTWKDPRVRWAMGMHEE